MDLKVNASFNGEEKELSGAGQDKYSTIFKAPQSIFKTDETQSIYPLEINATDESENIATITKNVAVNTNAVFPIKFIATNENLEEIGYINDLDIDIDIGDTNDFEITMKADEWDKDGLNFKGYIVCPKTEYGGRIGIVNTKTSTNEVVLSGISFRGLLTKHIVVPPLNESHLILNGELNSLIKQIIGERFNSLFVVSNIDTGVTVSNYQVDRYITVYDCLVKLLSSKDYRLQIEYINGVANESGYVLLQAVPIMDYSEQLEYSQDNNITFDITDNRQGINHLICGGKGENQDREIIHLYVQEDGTIGDKQYYFGLDERVEFYDYSSAENTEELRNSGIEKLKELQNYKQIKININNIDVEIGDIVGGRDRITGITLKKPIINKILTVKEGQTNIQYKVKGDD